jgi:hypothetical protein
MADPRAIIKGDGVAEEYLTLKIDNSTIVYDSTKVGGSAGVGLAVNLSGQATVQLVSDAAAVLGKLVDVRPDNFATVQIGGACLLPGGVSATLTAGSRIVGALGAASAKGYIRSVAAATLAEVAVANGTIIDSTDATNVLVYLT